MANISKELQGALESDCARAFQPVILAKKPEDFEALQSLLSLDPAIEPQHRAKAMALLGRWGDPAPVAAIRRLLPELGETERVTAVDALGRLGTEEALEGVLERSEDSSPHVRKFVARALTRIDTERARTKLKDLADKDSTAYVREYAGKLLAKRGQ